MQDPENDVRVMGDALSELFELKYTEFVRQEREQQVPCCCSHSSMFVSLAIVTVHSVVRKWLKMVNWCRMKTHPNSLSSGSVRCPFVVFDA